MTDEIEVKKNPRPGPPFRLQDEIADDLGGSGVGAGLDEKVTLELIYLLSDHYSDLSEMMHALTKFLKYWSGVEAVGIRLREGFDFPYYVTLGFPERFVVAERWLCARDQAGEFIRDSKGNPTLECMCGNVIRGRFDPELPFFTSHGSFWSNCTTELLATTTETERQTRTRNRCNGEGYETVALVPLKTNEETFGLIQFNDFRPNGLSLEMVRALEKMADTIALGLAQRRVEEALISSEQRFRGLFEHAAVGIVLINREGRFLRINKHFCRLFGYGADRLLTMNFLDLVHPQDLSLVMEKIWLIIEGGIQDLTLESRYQARDRPVLWGKNTISAMRNPNGDIGYLICVFEDITDRKEAEAALRESEETSRVLLNSIDGSAALLDPQGIVLSANENMAQRTGSAVNLLVGRSTYEFLPEELADKRRKYIDQVVTTGRTVRFEHEEGGRFFNNTISPVFGPQGNVSRLAFLGVDITDRKKAEEVVSAALDEKVLLLREIHHRVKNNMAVVSGLLRLQARKTKDEKLTKILQESQNRIMAMSIIHESLYRTGDLSAFDMNHYILRLARSIYRTYSTNKKRIELDTHLEDFDLAFDKAVPTGLVINELMSNALKHAFPGSRSGRIDIYGRGHNPDKYELIFQDNGIGLPRDFDPLNSQTLGLDLVIGLVEKQMGGSVDIESDKGTRFIISIPRPRKGRAGHGQ